MRVSLFRYTQDPTLTIDTIASICYDSEPSSDGNIMSHCYKSGHTSVLEFVDFVFLVEDVSRTLLAQLTRHRHASFAVRSQRYCNESNFEVYIPPHVEKEMYWKQEYLNYMSTVSKKYRQLQNNGFKNEDARMVLPNACMTSLYVKFNLRSLINFCNERMCVRAQQEIRELANAIKKCVLEVDKNFDNMLVPKCEKLTEYPFCQEVKGCGKHPKLSEVYGR